MVVKQLSKLTLLLCLGVILLIVGCSEGDSDIGQVVERDQTSQGNDSDEVEESFEEDFVEENSSDDEVEIGQLY